MLYVFSRFLGDQKAEDLPPINDIWDFQSKSQSDGWDEDLPPIKKRSNFQSRNQSGGWDKGIFKNYLYEFYGRYFDFTGKTNRTDYWTTYLVSSIIGLFLYFIISPRLMILISFISIIPGISIQIRRLRDIGKSPEWILLNFLPIIGPFLLLFWLAKPSNYFSKRPLNVAFIDSEQVIEKGISNIENQLEKLKSMLSKKLITEEEYKSMRRKILEDF
tara:strand:- start:94 stop:744 length:651 start_codon:yes stop_codon:yes gene_type:complete